MSKKILHVVNISFVLPYYIGDQFDNFQALGLETYVACTASDHLLQYSQQKGFRPIAVNILREINLLSDIKAILFLRKMIIEENIEIVIGHTPKGALIGMIASYLGGVKKRIYFRHGLMYETSKGLKRNLLKIIERLTGGIATKVVCVSESVKRRSIFENLNNPAKIILLNKGTCNGLDHLKFSKKGINIEKTEELKLKYNISFSDTVIGYVGRLVNDKGINELLASWQLLSRRYANLKLLLVGPFEDRDSIGQVEKDYINKTSSIIHTGLIHEVAPFYTLMDIFILPSYREGFPTVVLEASSMELPIITTKSTGCIDSIIENETGVFCEISAASISQAIQFYLEHRDIAKQHGKNGRKFVISNFKQEIIWKEIEDKVLELK